MEPLENGLHRRFLEEIDLREVSILDNRKVPAYAGTSIEARGQEETVLEQRSREDIPEVVSRWEAPKADVGNRMQEMELLRLKGAYT